MGRTRRHDRIATGGQEVASSNLASPTSEALMLLGGLDDLFGRSTLPECAVPDLPT